MLFAIIKVLGMLYPFLKEAYLTKNKYKRNKTVITLIVVAIAMMLFMSAAMDTTYTLYKQNKLAQEEMLKLKAELDSKGADCTNVTAILDDLNKRIDNLSVKPVKK